MISFRTLTALCVMLLSGCASIMSGSTEQVTVNSSPTGAEFLIKDQNGNTVHQGMTPATVTLKRGDGYFDGQRYAIDFSSSSYLPQTYSINSSVNKWYFGNLGFGGLLGTFVVDPITGAMWSLPDTVNVDLFPTR